MMTLKQFVKGLDAIPALASWRLADIGEAKGRQELFIRQSPQRLKMLREHALIESAVSSNRIEGIEIEHKRIATVVFGNRPLHDRSEEEVRGYREALHLIHSNGPTLPVTETTLRQLHRLTRGEIGDAGIYKEKDVDIIEKHADGRSRVRFKTVSAKEISTYMGELILLWQSCLAEKKVHPYIAMAAFNLDFLCIHPFRDGNGRTSRLLMLLMCYHMGLEVGRYISLERLIEQNKERYYETLEASSSGWHEGKHNPWPYIHFVLFILKDGYKEFEERLEMLGSPKGDKTASIIEALNRSQGDFRISDIRKACPNVSIDLIRRVLKDLQAQKRIECLSRGQKAVWRKIVTTTN